MSPAQFTPPPSRPQAPRRGAAVAHCGSGAFPPQGPRTAPSPMAAAVAHCGSGVPPKPRGRPQAPTVVCRGGKQDSMTMQAGGEEAPASSQTATRRSYQAPRGYQTRRDFLRYFYEIYMRFVRPCFRYYFEIISRFIPVHFEIISRFIMKPILH